MWGKNQVEIVVLVKDSKGKKCKKKDAIKDNPVKDR